jgi:hypothetical protein
MPPKHARTRIRRAWAALGRNADQIGVLLAALGLLVALITAIR